MIKGMKKFLAGMLVAAVAVTAVPAISYAATSPTTSVEPVKQTEVTAEKKNGIEITVNTSTSGKATISEIEPTTKKTVTVASKVTVNGVSYTVNKISANAFENCEKATKVSLPSTITTIGAKAFSGNKTIKTIALTSKNAPTISKTAFKGVDTKKMTITYSSKMSKSEIKELKAALKAAGFKGTVKKAK